MLKRYWIVATALGLISIGPLNAQENVDHPVGQPEAAQEQAAEQTAVEPASSQPATTAPTDESGPEHNQGTPTDSNENPYQYPDIILGDGWAQWAMVALSFFALLVSAWAVWLLRDTLKATREAVRSADDAVAITEKYGKVQLRSYVLVDTATLGSGELGPFVGVELINAGQTPARNVSIDTAVSIVDASDGEPIWGERQYDEGGDIGSNCKISFWKPVSSKKLATANSYENRGRYQLILSGTAHYTDVFGVGQTTKFSYETHAQNGIIYGPLFTSSFGNSGT